ISAGRMSPWVTGGSSWCAQARVSASAAVMSRACASGRAPPERSISPASLPLGARSMGSHGRADQGAAAARAPRTPARPPRARAFTAEGGGPAGRVVERLEHLDRDLVAAGRLDTAVHPGPTAAAEEPRVVVAVR